MFLTVNGCRIATSYSLCYARRLFLCKTGYDPDYDTCSPFKVLTYLAVRDSFVHGLREVEFLGDTEPWRQFFAGYPRLEAKFQGRRLIIKGVSDEEEGPAEGNGRTETEPSVSPASTRDDGSFRRERRCRRR